MAVSHATVRELRVGVEAVGGRSRPADTVPGVTNPALAFRPAPGTIPDEPGCYQFKDAHGRVIYVGKA